MPCPECLCQCALCVFATVHRAGYRCKRGWNWKIVYAVYFSLLLCHPDIDKMNVDFESNSRKINIKQCELNKDIKCSTNTNYAPTRPTQQKRQVLCISELNMWIVKMISFATFQHTHTHTHFLCSHRSTIITLQSVASGTTIPLSYSVVHLNVPENYD